MSRRRLLADPADSGLITLRLPNASRNTGKAYRSAVQKSCRSLWDNSVMGFTGRSIPGSALVTTLYRRADD